MRFVLVFCFFVSIGFCQTNNLIVGNEWWYSKIESFIDTTKEGYSYLKITKDTVVLANTYKILTEENFSSKGKNISKNKRLIKSDSGIVFYKYINDTSWYYLLHNQPVVNKTFIAKIRKGQILDKDTIVSLSITGVSINTINGISVQKYSVSFSDKRYELYDNEIMTSLGGLNLFFPIITYKNVADVYLGGSIRCLKYQNNLLKFDAGKSCDTTIYVIPTYTGILKSYSSEIHVFPNPSNGVFEIEFDENFALKNIEIVNNQGVLIEPIYIKNDNKLQILNELKSGVYLIKLVSKNNVISKKLIKI